MGIARLAVVAAPLCMLAYGIIRLIGRMDGVYGPGLDWQAAHLADLAGLILFVFLVSGIRRLLTPGRGRDAVVITTVVGAAASIVQFAADIVEGLLAADKAGMRELSRQFHALPGVDLAFYQVGPQLLYVGMIALTAMLAYERKLPWWSVALVVAASLLPVMTLDLIPLSAAGYLAALIPLWRRLERPVSTQVGESLRPPHDHRLGPQAPRAPGRHADPSRPRDHPRLVSPPADRVSRPGPGCVSRRPDSRSW